LFVLKGGKKEVQGI